MIARPWLGCMLAPGRFIFIIFLRFLLIFLQKSKPQDCSCLPNARGLHPGCERGIGWRKDPAPLGAGREIWGCLLAGMLKSQERGGGNCFAASGASRSPKGRQNLADAAVKYAGNKPQQAEPPRLQPPAAPGSPQLRSGWSTRRNVLSPHFFSKIFFFFPLASPCNSCK